MLYLHNIINGIWMINEDFAANYIPLVKAYLRGEPINKTNRVPEEFLTIHNGNDSREQIMDIREATLGSIAIINIAGVITKYDQYCGPDGMASKASILEACYNTENIKGIVIRIDSGGGEGQAMRLFAEKLTERNKPVVAFIDDYACSAAYGIASAADVIVANSPLAQIGSIGTYLTVADYSKQWEMEGIRLIEIYASSSPDKNKDYYEAIKGNLEPLRKVADHFNDGFLKMIETNRGDKLKTDRETWGTGKVFFADKAKKDGLIDEIDSFNNILNYFV
jgi:ClpP class serine protease